MRIGDVSQDLADLVRLFLLRRLLPLQRVVALLGEEITSAFLQLQAFCLIVGPNSRVCSASEAAEILSTASHNADLELFSAIAIWPLEEDLLIATDYGDTQHSAHFEPVMYLSLDSYALVSAAPREPVQRVLDVCCGSGVQGIVALRTYAEQATFVDINPRCLAFTRFNAALNGFYERASFIQGSVDTLTDLGLFQAPQAHQHIIWYRQTGKLTETDRPTERPADSQPGSQAGRQTGRPTDRHTDRQTDGRTDREPFWLETAWVSAYSSGWLISRSENVGAIVERESWSSRVESCFESSAQEE